MGRPRTIPLTVVILALAGILCIVWRLATGMAGASPRMNGPWTDILDLTRLPRQTQEVLAVLLILPLGAVLTSLVRNVVGFQTFGTLMPNLLALSFLETDCATAAGVFAVVMLVGLGGRAVVGRLRLLIGPRLGLVLTATVLCLVVAISLADHLGLAMRTTSILLPMVVLTILVERFYISIEENGLGQSLKSLATTLAVSLACLALLQWAAMGRLAVRFPEGELFVAIGLILIGRYDGYRLTELRRFRDLGKDGEEPT